MSRYTSHGMMCRYVKITFYVFKGMCNKYLFLLGLFLITFGIWDGCLFFLFAKNKKQKQKLNEKFYKNFGQSTKC